jgi:nitrate/TMAO reductase-like tetraheme cytochrome c subunit
MMRRLLRGLKRFFFPPANTPLWVKVLPYALLGGLTLSVLAGGAYAWEYTNSPTFCGTACHTMPPEYSAYLVSPHARVDCVECHIGRDFIATRISRKAGDAKHIIAMTFHTYEYPIRSRTMRPARETCERCHFPEKFSDDSLREIKQFANDISNTPSSIYLVMKTGGGSQRVGLGRGIHWHIENQVYYLPLDPEEQEIPFVQVMNADGSTSTYVDVESDFDPSQVDLNELKEMDCITCHNRITHQIYTPEVMVNQLLERGLVSPHIPEIRNKAVEVYSKIYGSVEMGINGIAGLAGYYQVYHPEYFAKNGDEIEAAITALQEAYRQNVFPEQKVDWNTHPDNIGHKDSPGCFRCHGGKHLNDEQKAIRLECNICHSIPVVAGPGDFVASIEISRGPEPQSHLDPNWIGLHHLAFNSTCENCHTTANPGGTDDSSFCSNSACHGSVWEYAGFDAPRLREILLSQLPPVPTPQPVTSTGELTFSGIISELLNARCGSCHGPATNLGGLDLTSYPAILAGGPSGPAIVPGDPTASLVIQKMQGDRPHFNHFTPAELGRIVEWIEAGSPE